MGRSGPAARSGSWVPMTTAIDDYNRCEALYLRAHSRQSCSLSEVALSVDRNHRLNSELAGQSLQRHILRNGIVGNEYVCPGFTLIACGVIGGTTAPFDGNVLFCEDIGNCHLVRSFGLQHENAGLRLRDEIGLIF